MPYTIPIGVPTTIQQNVVYALPWKLCQISATVAAQTSVDGSAWAALTNNTVVAATFIKCTTANSVIVCKDAAGMVS